MKREPDVVTVFSVQRTCKAVGCYRVGRTAEGPVLCHVMQWIARGTVIMDVALWRGRAVPPPQRSPYPYPNKKDGWVRVGEELGA